MNLNMKFAVAVVALAAAAGCRYSDAAGDGKDGAGASSANQAVDINSDNTFENADAGSLEDIAGDKRFEDYCKKCDDVSFTPVYFGFDSTVVPQGELGKIDAVAAHLEKNADRVVVIEGNCDERGSNEYNMSLGENRAIIIRNYLVNNGVAADRIQTRSYGEERPAVEGQGEGAWAKNRRGEFAIFQK